MLLKQFNLRHTKLETIYLTEYIQQSKAKYMVKVESSREKSIESEASDMANFKIFLDESEHDNGIGSAAILYQKDSGQKKMIQAYLGPAKNTTLMKKK